MHKDYLDKLKPLAYEDWVEIDGKVIEPQDAIPMLFDALEHAMSEASRLGGIESFSMGESDRADIAEHELRKLRHKIDRTIQLVKTNRYWVDKCGWSVHSGLVLSELTAEDSDLKNELLNRILKMDISSKLEKIVKDELTND